MVERVRDATGRFVRAQRGCERDMPAYTRFTGKEWRRLSLTASTVRARVVFLRRARDAYHVAGDYINAKLCQDDLDILSGRSK